jgi:hypothetical protein
MENNELESSSKFTFQIFSLWAVSSRKYRGLNFTSQDVGIVLAISGMRCFFKLYILFIVQEIHSQQNVNETKIDGPVAELGGDQQVPWPPLWHGSTRKILYI